MKPKRKNLSEIFNEQSSFSRAKVDKKEKEKSLLVTYLLWLFFGIYGAHHVYLRRDRQAFVWWSTLGGCFYVGWIRDLWRIPAYVDEANKEITKTKTVDEIILLRQKQPRVNVSRCLGEVFVGFWYGLLVHFAIPEGFHSVVIGGLVSLGITSGVYLVGSIGKECGPFIKPYLASFVCFLFWNTIGDGQSYYFYCSLCSAFVFNKYRQNRIDFTNPGRLKRASNFSGGAAIIIGLWTSYFYFNAALVLDEGETIKLRDSLNHFFKSPAWTEFKETMWTLYGQAQNDSWENVFDDFIVALDPTGEKHAYKVLKLESNATEEDVRRAYKKLVVKWHPDRHGDAAKEEAEKQFIEIQQAYELLSARKKTSKSRTEKKRTEF